MMTMIHNHNDDNDNDNDYKNLAQWPRSNVTKHKSLVTLPSKS